MRITEAMMIASAIEVNNLQFGAIRTLIEAAKKQEPMKPVGHIREVCGTPEWYGTCPGCGEVAVEYFKYCPDCGQKLDWED